MKNIILILLVLTSIISCEPIEVEVQDSSNFNIKAEYIAINEIETEIETFIDIIPKDIAQDSAYSFKYEIQEGEGFLIMESTILSSGQEYKFEGLGFVPRYIGKTNGQHEVNIYIKNNKGLEKEHKLTYQITEPKGFELDIIFNKNENYVNEYTDFVIRINNKGNEELTYKAYFRNIQGELKIFDKNETIAQNELFDLNKEIINGKFKSLVIEEKEIEFIIEASNGVIKSKKIKYNSLLTNFEVTITPTPLRGSFFGAIEFNMLITPPENLIQKIDYYMYFTSSNLGNLSLELSGTEEGVTGASPGFKVNLGSSTFMNGDLEELGIGSPRKGTITFYFNDSNGAKYETSAEVEFYE